jgi:hypothetical protein
MAIRPAKKLNADASQWEVLFDGEKVGEVKWALVGEHNMPSSCSLQQPIAITCFRLMSFSGRIILPLPGTMRTFDKRSKFVHYCPRTLILNNLEFDHADIFDDLKASSASMTKNGLSPRRAETSKLPGTPPITKPGW